MTVKGEKFIGGPLDFQGPDHRPKRRTFLAGFTENRIFGEDEQEIRFLGSEILHVGRKVCHPVDEGILLVAYVEHVPV